MSVVFCALLHHPVRARDGSTVTTAVTNLDVHDIARIARSYGLANYFIVSPIEAQRQLVERILGHWRDGAGKKRIPERADALSRVLVVQSLEAVVGAIAAGQGAEPLVIATAARPLVGREVTPYAQVAESLGQEGPPALILFGTGHGLTDGVLRNADLLLPPIQASSDYNHLSVRAAAAITLDRLLGDRIPEG
jgi:hypothetical protein